jgi:spermidine/putrescine-binding protein
LRPYITNFHSSQYINDLANGDICLVVGWSGDIIQARDRAAEAANGVNIAYPFPRKARRSGSTCWPSRRTPSTRQRLCLHQLPAATRR